MQATRAHTRLHRLRSCGIHQRRTTATCIIAPRARGVVTYRMTHTLRIDFIAVGPATTWPRGHPGQAGAPRPRTPASLVTALASPYSIHPTLRGSARGGRGAQRLPGRGPAPPYGRLCRTARRTPPPVEGTRSPVRLPLEPRIASANRRFRAGAASARRCAAGPPCA